MFIGIDRAAGIWIRSERSEPPNSSTSTRLPPSADRRSASTQPAEPAPTITKSNCSTARAISVRRLDGAEIDVDALQLRVVLDRRLAVLAAEAGLLGAPEGQLDRGHVVVVDPAGAGLQPRDGAVAAREVLREDAGRQPEGGVVGARDDLILV